MYTDFRKMRSELEGSALRDLKHNRNVKESLKTLQEYYYTASEESFLILLIFHLSSGLERIAESIRSGAIRDVVFEQHLSDIVGMLDELGAINASEQADENRCGDLIRRFEEKRIKNSTMVLQISEAGDHISGFEYVLNRREADFMPLSLPEGYNEDLFIRRLFGYLTSPSEGTEKGSKEAHASIIMERLVDVMEQLPFRMTKKRFFSLVEDDFSVYENGEKRTFRELLDSLNMSIFLKDLPSAREAFPQVDGYIRELEEADLLNLDEKTFVSLKGCIDSSADYLNEMLDLMMSWQEIMNAALGYLDARMVSEKNGFVSPDPETMAAGRKILGSLCEIRSLIPAGSEGRSSDETETTSFPKDVKDRQFAADDIDEAVTKLYEEFEPLEGIVENLTECEQFLSAHLEEFAVTYSTEIAEEDALSSMFGVFRILKLLQSNSDFVETASYRDAAEGLLPSEARKVDSISPEEIREAFADYQKRMTELLESLPKPLRRYKMAKTLSLLRIIPRDFSEIKTYVTDSLSGCADEAEKIAVIEILNDMIEKETQG